MNFYAVLNESDDEETPKVKAKAPAKVADGKDTKKPPTAPAAKPAAAKTDKPSTAPKEKGIQHNYKERIPNKF